MNNNTNNTQNQQKDEKPSDLIDLARMGIQANIVIKDKDTNNIILNKRG